MCGIAGYLGRNELDSGSIAQTLQRMKNRGPDYSASKHYAEKDFHVHLLHSRLSIIDLDERSNQPFVIGDYTIVFNGEIYNFLELKEELKQRGIQFRTSSDTEVLLQAYILLGDKCLEKLEGMWSFAIYNSREKTLFLARDRFAEKPLYFYETATGFYFASEIKFIQSLSGASLAVNERHLLRYLINGYKSLYKSEDTFFEGIREVPYATQVTVNSSLQKKIKRYWEPNFETNPKLTFEESVQGFREKLIDSMKIRLRADVPLAFCLSGGVDSAALVSIAAKIFKYDVATFSILDSDERYNEYDNIMATIKDLGCKHTLIPIPKEGTLPRLRSLIEYHDAPVYTISYYIHSLLSETVSKQGYKVAISGTAADEMVTGYYDHFHLHMAAMKNHPRYAEFRKGWETYVKPNTRNPFLQDADRFADNPGFRDHIYLNSEEFTTFLKKEFREGFYEQDFKAPMLRNRMLNELFHESVPVILHEDDLNSMCYSVENRSPFLDSRLFKFAYSIPDEHLFKDGYAKIILREAVKGILNDKVRLDRRKRGFNASLNSLVDFTDKKVRDYVLDDSVIFDYVDREKIASLLSINPMPNSLSKFIFYFLNAKMFLEIHTRKKMESSL